MIQNMDENRTEAQTAVAVLQQMLRGYPQAQFCCRHIQYPFYPLKIPKVDNSSQLRFTKHEFSFLYATTTRKHSPIVCKTVSIAAGTRGDRLLNSLPQFHIPVSPNLPAHVIPPVNTALRNKVAVALQDSIDPR